MRDYDCLWARNGVLQIEGVSTVDLVEQFGTPLFVFSEGQIAKTCGASEKCSRKAGRVRSTYSLR